MCSSDLKTSRDPMCPGVLSGGVRGARWTQIDAIARADMLCRPVEWRLACQMICGKAWNRALTAVRGRLGVFLQTLGLQEQGTEGYYDLRERGTPVHRRLSPNNRNPHQRTARVREFAKGWSRNLLRRNQAKLTPSTAETLSTKSGVFMDKMAFRAVLSTE